LIFFLFSDNPQVDILGANLFNRSLQRNPDRRRLDAAAFESKELYFESLDANHLGIVSCDSVLVCTGVYSGSSRLQGGISTEVQGDVVMDEALCVPSVSTVHNVLEAVQVILGREVLLEKHRR